MGRKIRTVVVLMSSCLMSAAAFAQSSRPALPECRVQQKFGDWSVSAHPATAFVSLPPNPSRPLTKEGFGDEGWISLETMSLELSTVRPRGTIKSLSAEGAASIRFVASTGAHQLDGTYKFESIPEDPGHPATGYAALDVVALAFRHAGSVAVLLEEAAARGESVEMTAKAREQTIMQYKLNATGFDNAIKWAEQGKREMADLLRAGKCKDIDFFRDFLR